jgi:hypothetical protein
MLHIVVADLPSSQPAVQSFAHSSAPIVLPSFGSIIPVRTLGKIYTLSSDHATLFLRYRPQPVGVEVVSIGRDREDGPAMMVRVPGDGEQADRGVLFIASKLANSDPPPPFASVRACVDAGWIEEPLRSLDMSDMDREKLRSWLASVVFSKH